LEADGHWVVLEVQDTGAGMDEATRARVFEPFFTTKAVGKGTGLGLATVYGIVTAMHGEIEVQSAPGTGSTFRAWLPAADGVVHGSAGGAADGHSSTASASNLAREPQHAASILVVEDEPSVRLLAHRILGKAGYTVREACNGVEALAALQAPDADFALVLSDAVMPEMGGRALVQQMRARGVRVPVLFMSGYTADTSPLPGTRAEQAILVSKPFTAQELTTRVREVLADPGLG
jgi:CheY-like chemotaxis protein